MNRILTLIIAIFLVTGLTGLQAQNKPKSGTGKGKSTTTTTQKKGTTTQKGKTTGKGTEGKKTTADTKKPGEPAEAKAGKIDPAKADTFRLQIAPLVRFFESSLNFLGDKRNDVSDMQTIITESYLKWCWNDKVQVEDDLDENRLVPLYKDMPAYLSDVDFFFRGAKFTYTVQDISLETNPQGLTYFKVTANRNLRALTVGGDSINSNKVRYIEMNYDSAKQQLKIVSVYTTKLNEKDDLRNWWNTLSPEWKSILGSEMKLEGTLPMAQIENFNDSVAIVGGQKRFIMGSEFYNFLNQIINTTNVDLSGRKTITDLSPIGRLSELKNLNISNTGVADLMPLRNMNQLEVLDISHTQVTSLEPLRYCIQINQLRMRNTRVSDISVISSFTNLSLLDIGNTAVSDLSALEELGAIRDLRINGTKVKNLDILSGMTRMEMLNISGTSVSDISPLRRMGQLKVLTADSTGITSLTAFDSLGNLQRVYCNYTKIGRKEALQFLKKHPEVSLVYATKDLTEWWKTMGQEWQSQFAFYMNLGNPPTTEQLHKLVLIDSVNITGRASITSLQPVSKLVMLRVLFCQTTGITTLDPLKDLTELQVVNASNTAVTSLQPLTGSLNLQMLSIDNTKVTDLSPLYGLQKLKLVFADNSGVVDAQADKFAEKVPGCILVYQTYENTDWWGRLSNAWKDVLKQQESIKGEPDKIQLQKLAGLTKVSINENFEISDLSPLLQLTRLRELSVSGTTVSSLEPVGKMPRLNVLKIQKNPVTNLMPIALLRELKELDFSNTQVEDLDALQNMLQLEVLKFSGTQVKNLKYLQKLVNLRVLEFYNTRVTTIDVLDGMNKLESVKLFNTKVSAKKVEKLKSSHPKCEIVYY